MGEAWRGRCVFPSILTGRRAASNPVNYYNRGVVKLMTSNVRKWDFENKKPQASNQLEVAFP